MIYTDMTKKAIRLAFEAHAGQYDKSGLPYILHPIHLAEQMTDELSTVCAVLHDVVEDTPWTLEELRQEGFPEEVIQVLRLLTHCPSLSYSEYIRQLSGNSTARKVKLADLRHNSDLSRLETVDQKALNRVEKYRQAIRFLEEIEGDVPGKNE